MARSTASDFEVFAAHPEVEMNPGEDLRVGRRAFGPKTDLASRNGVSPALQNQYDVERGNTAGSGKQHLHRSRPRFAASFRGSIHEQKA